VSTLIRAIELLVTAMMGLIAAVVIAEVGLRNFFDYSLIITDELSRYTMVWTALLAAALLLYDDAHIRIALLTDALPPRLGMAVYLVSQAVMVGFLGVVIYATILVMPSLSEQNTVTLGISIAWFYAALPVSFALMILITVRAVYRRLRSLDAAG
jgi:TRAP-type C4-dicarboxylate transport system permease small subunit